VTAESIVKIASATGALPGRGGRPVRTWRGPRRTGSEAMISAVRCIRSCVPGESAARHVARRAGPARGYDAGTPIGVSEARGTEPPVPESLLQRVAAGDASAVRECLSRFGGLVWSLARRFSRNDPEAEDAVQEIFVEVWRNASRYDPAIASETAFVAMIARRRLIDRRRKQSRRPESAGLPDSDLGVSDAMIERSGTSEEAGRAAEALRELSPDQQRVLRLSIMHGLSHEKIAAATGLPMGTVKTHARRGLIRLRELLRRDGGERAVAGRAAVGTGEGAS